MKKLTETQIIDLALKYQILSKYTLLFPFPEFTENSFDYNNKTLEGKKDYFEKDKYNELKKIEKIKESSKNIKLEEIEAEEGYNNGLNEAGNKSNLMEGFKEDVSNQNQ